MRKHFLASILFGDNIQTTNFMRNEAVLGEDCDPNSNTGITFKKLILLDSPKFTRKVLFQKKRPISEIPIP